jgi:hypothetical protein
MTQATSSVGDSIFFALAGMNAAERGLAGDAASVAADGPTVDDMVDLAVQPTAFAANGAVLGAALDVARSTVDLLA